MLVYQRVKFDVGLPGRFSARPGEANSRNCLAAGGPPLRFSNGLGWIQGPIPGKSPEIPAINGGL